MEFELEYLTKNLEGTGGKIKETSECFMVEEVPVYECSGEGDHLIINSIL